MEKAVLDSDSDENQYKLLTKDSLSFLNEVDISKLKPRQFSMFKQTVCLLKLLDLSFDGKFNFLDFEGI